MSKPIDLEAVAIYEAGYADALADSAREREALLDKVLEIIKDVPFLPGPFPDTREKLVDEIARRVRELKGKP